MEKTLAVSQGIWRVEQDVSTLHVWLLRYGDPIDEWDGDKRYSFEELHDILLKESYKRRKE